MDLEIYDDDKLLTQPQHDWVEKLVEFAGNYLKLPKDTEMSITFMNNEAIHAINLKYRKTDRATDVISFAIEEDPDDDLPADFEAELGMPRNIGDLMISTEKAAEQAQEYGHSFQRELGYTVVHGFLHLNGYDHMEPAEEKTMFDLQREILDAYGLKR